jgi:dTMP kinase
VDKVNCPFVVFEGVDGAGKTEISTLVAKKLKGLHLESPTGRFRELRKYVDDNLCDNGRFHFYLASSYELSNKVDESKSSYPAIICARYVHSTIIGYASRQNINIENAYETILGEFNGIGQPDLTIFLDVDLDAQRLRITSRADNVNTKNDYMCLTNDIYQKRLSDNYRYVQIKENWHYIDTSAKTIDEVVDLSIELINGIRFK